MGLPTTGASDAKMRSMSPSRCSFLLSCAPGWGPPCKTSPVMATFLQLSGRNSTPLSPCSA
eukprot:1095352-Pyramimonas_sp.AAC.1